MRRFAPGLVALGALGALMAFVAPSGFSAVHAPTETTVAAKDYLVNRAPFILPFVALALFGFALWRQQGVALLRQIDDWLQTRPPTVFLAIAGGLAGAVRLGWILALPNGPVSDSIMYDVLARGLVEEGRYSWRGTDSALVPVGYPLLLAGAYQMAPSWTLAPKIVNVMLSLGIVAFTFAIGRRVVGSPAARWATLLVAVSPSQIAACGLLVTEVAFTFFLLGALYVSLQSRIGPAGALVAGSLAGIGALVRPTLLPFPLLYSIILWLRGVPVRRVARSAALAAVGMAVVIGPWTLRNYRLFGEFIPITTGGGTALWVSNNEFATGSYLLNVNGRLEHYLEHLDPRIEELRSEIARERAYRDRAIAFIKNNPQRFLSLAFRKVVYLYANDNDALNWTLDGLPSGHVSVGIAAALHAITFGHYVFVLFLILLYVTVYRWKLPMAGQDLPLWLVVGYATAVHFVYLGDSRYHFAMMPLLIIVASAAWSGWLRTQPGSTSVRTPRGDPGETQAAPMAQRARQRQPDSCEDRPGSRSGRWTSRVM